MPGTAKSSRLELVLRRILAPGFKEISNVEGSRFCDVCGAAIWMAGRSSSSLENGNGNGSNGNSRQPAPSVAPSVAPSGAQVSAEHISLAGLQPDKAHATLQIERGVSAG